MDVLLRVKAAVFVPNGCAAAALLVLTLPLGCGRKADTGQFTVQPVAPLPTEVAGFRFGMSVADFESHCKDVGKPNPLVGDDGDARTHTCDGVEVEPGMKLNVFLGFCQGDSRLCEVNYWTNRNAARAYAILNAKLIQRYGQSTDVNSTLREEGLEEQCANGGGKLRRTWWWGKPSAPTGRLLISFDCKPGDQFVGVYFDDQLGAANQVKIAKSKGSWPF